MKERTTQLLLAVIAALALAHLVRPVAEAEDGTVAPVVRARAFELVNQQGLVVAQLYFGEDGGGNIRLRSGDGTVRVKLGADDDGSGLLLLDREVEPAVWLLANQAGTKVTIAEQGKRKRILRPRGRVRG